MILYILTRQKHSHKVVAGVCLVYLELVVLGVVQLAHQAVDVGRSISTDVGDEECDEFRGDVIKHGTVSIHLRQDLT